MIDFHKASLDKLHPSKISNGIKVRLPRKFREQRALSILIWFLPDDFLKWELLLALKDRHNLEKIEFNWVQEIELRCLLDSKEHCLSYLEKTINPREIFGTILKEDLENALRILKFSQESEKTPKRIIRRKGYRDKGSVRPSHRWLPNSDFSLDSQQNNLDFQKKILKLLTLLYLRKLED